MNRCEVQSADATDSEAFEVMGVWAVPPRRELQPLHSIPTDQETELDGNTV